MLHFLTVSCMLDLKLCYFCAIRLVGTNQIHGKKCMISRRSREKMHDFMAEFSKCVKFHGKFTERVSEIHGKFMGPTDVISRCCANANEEISEQRIFTTLSQDSRQSMSTT